MLVSKSAPRSSSKGGAYGALVVLWWHGELGQLSRCARGVATGKYCVWSMSDLAGTAVTLLLFADAYEGHKLVRRFRGTEDAWAWRGVAWI